MVNSCKMIQAVQLFPSEREKLLTHLQPKLETAPYLDRRMVSFQANKLEPGYRLFKYKEGFSSALVRHFLKEYAPTPGRLLDPFAGSGTALFAGRELGWSVSGIELLPVGTLVTEAREAIGRLKPSALQKSLALFFANPELPIDERFTYQHLSITKDAFPTNTEQSLNRYLTFCSNIRNKDLQTVMRFAAFPVLEEISYTRKDGQYLRWDSRSRRNLTGKPFDKGVIHDFETAIANKIEQIIEDGDYFEQTIFPQRTESSDFRLVTGSCLEVLPICEPERFDFVITSPPYCNRYDYTRTYALELAYLGVDDLALRKLRQNMLSCTVENKDKFLQMEELYRNIGKNDEFQMIADVYARSEAMNEVNIILGKLNHENLLNNKNIARMVRNYFFEMCFVVFELARVTRKGGHCVMVNDNVRYGGEEIPADLILSDFAQSFGYVIEKILVLPRGKGNSSQQMGNFGRTEIRKCVYVWRKD